MTWETSSSGMHVMGLTILPPKWGENVAAAIQMI